MNEPKAIPKTVRIVRYIARVWSIVLLAFVLLRIFTPDPYATEPVPPVDWFLLGLWGLALLALLIAWKWELLGGAMAIAIMVVRDLAWILIKGSWFAGFLILWLAILPPAILYLVAWGLERRAQVE